MFNSRKEFFLIFIFLFSKTSCLLNLEELNNVDYGIDILSKPLLLREFPSSQSVVLTSIYGQDYQCVIPDHAKDEEIKKEKEKIAVEIGIPDLLKPMESSPCLVYTKDWWTYEFCYGKYIKQYHLQKDEISGVITYLGYYESEYNWSDKTQNKTNSRLDKYHSQRYVNGTTCDLTNNPRETEVRFKCDDVGGDHISHINEPETCFYIVTVNTNKVCHHPYLRPPVTKNGVDIKCNPLLSQEEMNEYQNTVEKDLKKKKEIDDAEKKEKEVNLEELTKESENSDKSESSNDDELLAELDTKTTSSLKKLFTDALTESIQEIMDENEDMDEFVAVGGQELKNLMDTGKKKKVPTATLR